MTAPIGITMGDPAGVGPEIILRSLAALRPTERARYRVFGNRESLAAAETVLRTGMDLAALDVHHTDIPGAPLPFGKLDDRGAKPAFASSRRPSIRRWRVRSPASSRRPSTRPR